MECVVANLPAQLAMRFLIRVVYQQHGVRMRERGWRCGVDDGFAILVSNKIIIDAIAVELPLALLAQG